MINGPSIEQYDYDLGANEPCIIAYIKENTEINSRISPTRAYILFQRPSGSSAGSSISPFSVETYTSTSPNYRATIWSSGSVWPDTRPYTNEGRGSITVAIDDVIATRVLDVDDLRNDNEFAIVTRKDLVDAPVELVFNKNFNASAHGIGYYYSTMLANIDISRVKRGEGASQSLFGWTQYFNNSYDKYRSRHQVLVRLPMTTRDLIVNEEGKVTLESNDSWMIWEPYVQDFDLLVIPSNQTASGKEERYEIVDKKDSFIQGSLITQRFKLRFLERSDKRYTIPYVTTEVTIAEEAGGYLIFDEGVYDGTTFG